MFEEMFIGRSLEPHFLTPKKRYLALKMFIVAELLCAERHEQMACFLAVPENRKRCYNPDELHRDQGKCYLKIS